MEVRLKQKWHRAHYRENEEQRSPGIFSHNSQFLLRMVTTSDSTPVSQVQKSEAALDTDSQTLDSWRHKQNVAWFDGAGFLCQNLASTAWTHGPKLPCVTSPGRWPWRWKRNHGFKSRILSDRVLPFMASVYRLLMATSSKIMLHVTEEKSQTRFHEHWYWVQFPQRSPSVTGCVSNRKPLRCGRKGKSQHDCPADESVGTMWCFMSTWGLREKEGHIQYGVLNKVLTEWNISRYRVVGPQWGAIIQV